MQNLQSLNPAQLKCVQATEGAVLVLAGAGSGKTRVLTHRIANLVLNRGINPGAVLAITFTNKAAAEMRQRLLSMGLDAGHMWVCTIHSMCNRILRSHIDSLGYSKSFTIYDDADKERVIKRLLTDMGSDTDGELVKKIKWHISNAKNQLLTPEKYAQLEYGSNDLDTVIKVYDLYERELKKCNSLDFDDLIFKAYELLISDKEVRLYYQNKFSYVHIDEFQDTNTGQYKLIRLLAGLHGNIFAVGDDDQSIYGWRGAEVENVFRFQEDFKDVKVFKLEQNYRSTKKILEFANCIIKNNERRMDKQLFTENTDGVRVDKYVASDENDEAYYTASLIRSLVAYNGYKYSDFAVLMRLNAMSRAFEQEFLKYNIPYRVFGGFKFYERKEIKDIIAYLRLSSNPFDEESILRVINFPRRKIGDTAISQLRSAAQEEGMTLYEAILSVDDLHQLNSGLKVKIGVFRDIIKELLHASELLEKPQLIPRLLTITGIKDALSEDTDENINRRMNIDEFVNSFNQYFNENPQADIDDYLTSVTLISDIDEAQDNEDSVTVATVHAVKGLEFKTVFVCGLDDGIFPISRSFNTPAELEEERRLMYVAITRAMQRLYITRARSRFLYGSRKYTVESTFLKELSHFFEKPTQSFDESLRQQQIMSAAKQGSLGAAAKQSGLSYSYRGYSTNGTNTATTPYADNSSTDFDRAHAKNDTKTKEYDGIKTGVKVKHDKFGEGTVISVSGIGAGAEVSIAFPKIGIKTFALKFAPITLA